MPNAWTIFLFCILAVAIVGCGAGEEKATFAPSATPTLEIPGFQDAEVQPTVVASIPTPLVASTIVPTIKATFRPTDSPTATPEPTVAPVEQIMTGHVLDALARNFAEIELLRVRDIGGQVWEFTTEGPIGIDAAHLLVHRDIGAEVEVVYLEKDGRLIALQVNDFLRQ